MSYEEWCAAIRKPMNAKNFQEWIERELLIESIAQRVVEIMSQSQSQNKK